MTIPGIPGAEKNQAGIFGLYPGSVPAYSWQVCVFFSSLRIEWNQNNTKLFYHSNYSEYDFNKKKSPFFKMLFRKSIRL